MAGARFANAFAVAAGIALGAAGGSLRHGDSLGIAPRRGAPIVRRWGPETSHLYRFAVRRGDAFRIAAAQRSSDVALEVLLPGDGDPLWIDSPTSVLGSDEFEAVAARSGEVRLRLLDTGGFGRERGYRLDISRGRPAGARDRARAQAYAELARGDALRSVGDAEGATAAYEQAIARAVPSGARQMAALAHDHLADLAVAEEPTVAGAERAVGHFRAALALGPSPALAGVVLGQLADQLALLGRLEESQAAAEEELRLAERTGVDRARGIALRDLAYAANGRGDFEAALGFLLRSLPIWRAAGDRAEESETLVTIANVYLSLGSPGKAVAPLRASIDRLPPGDLGRVRRLTSLGRAYRDFARPDLARAAFGEALQLSRSHGSRASEASVLLGFGALELDLERNDEAERYLAGSKRLLASLRMPAVDANVESCLGVVAARRRDFSTAFRHFARAVDLYGDLGDLNDQATVMSHQAEAQRRSGDLAAARGTLESAIATIEGLRNRPLRPELRADLIGARHHYFERLVDLLIELDRRHPGQGYAELAFDRSEEARARTLLDEVAGGQPEVPRRLEEIRAALPPDVALVAFSLGEERSFVWVVRAGGLVHAPLPPAAEIEDLARSVAERIGRPPSGLPGQRARLRNDAARLSGLLLGPVAAQIAGARLAIVPDGALFTLPFASLPGPGAAGDAPERLIDRTEIVMLPSASLALALRAAQERRLRPARSVLAFGDPVLSADDERLGGARRRTSAVLRSGPDLARLPGTRREVSGILRLVAPGTGRALLDFAASREAALDPEVGLYRILHFATHGFVDPRRPERSGLVLSLFDARGRARDGILRVADLRRMRLAADLVVLSACDSAVGPEVRGEGPMSLGRAFLAAGAGSAVVSLWRVNDGSTAELMLRFYRALLREGLPPRAALRAAQRALREDPRTRDPFYWSGFVIEGDWR